MTDHISDRATWLKAFSLLFLLLLPLGFFRLGSHHLVSMEGIVADGARYMAGEHTADGEVSMLSRLMVPRLHGELYTYKPPGAYAMAWVSTSLFGDSEFTVRAPFVASGMVMALAIFWLVGRRFDPWTGALSGFASLTAVLTAQKLRLAEFDMPLAAGVGVAAALASTELSSEKPRAWRWQLAYVALLFAFLDKGIPSLMFFAPGLFLAAFWLGTWKRLFGIAHLAGFATFCIGVGGWIWGAWTAEGAAAFAQPLNEADAKGLSWTLEAVGATLLKPLIFLACFFPWSLPLGAASRGKDGILGGWGEVPGTYSPQTGLMRGAAAFIVAGLATFMAVPATETRYLLPLAGPVAILAGGLVAQNTPRARPRLQTITRWTTLFFAIVLTLVVPTAWAVGQVEDADAVQILIGALLGSVLWWINLPMIRQKELPITQAALSLAGLAFCLTGLQTQLVDPNRAESRSLKSTAEVFMSYLEPDEDVWVQEVSAEFRHASITYYFDRPLRSFQPGEPPPVGSAIILFSDEEPWKSGGPDFAHCPIEITKRRSFEFLLGRVGECPQPHSAKPGSPTEDR